MGAPFLITGLPRSRTFWLSKVVSVDGVSCEHEPSLHMNGLEALYNYYDSRLQSYNYVGISDCMVSPMLDTILTIMPMPTLIVMRPPNEVVQSLLAAGLDPSRLSLGMSGIAKVLNHPLVKTIEYKNLHNSYKVRKAIQHVMPSLKITSNRIEDFQSKILTIDAEENKTIWEASEGRSGNMKPIILDGTYEVFHKSASGE